ncbi:hypothetical protein [Rathayibacter rathayi]|uniref:hypothetical protein n=1 Tax=Rathayibacter rathayi TaxID=33887 RepID=UPI000BC79A60|nr:hypothetical protein [Rathayibacter rathayi]MWV75848.1 hypothetical protein [Rathayibacter rathayi NCPPB 2980 = VKM Ac-1601]TWD63640.1 hypothetical protein FB469_3115 [Rathayibacter rathayi]SOE05853.1 hypothetical protein SAMN06295924_11616 [Rathayibacter rathayi NCPPB 2980 = VKM Ac-1601]
MALARNKQKQPAPDPAAIAAFGAAAEATPATPPPAAPAVAPKSNPPKSSLVRWDGHQELRDRILTYGQTHRYATHDLMITAMERGMDLIENGD